LSSVVSGNPETTRIESSESRMGEGDVSGCVLRSPASEHSLQPPEGKSVSRGRSGQHTERISMDLLRIVIAILLPPLGVFLQVGIGKQFWINVLLTILGYVPGIVHAVWVIAKY
jgi:uncharacterized membrane protein YqaE (UPF0057 family)